MGSEHSSGQSERYRVTVDDFIKLEGAGAFEEHDRRLELIDGELLWMMVRTVPHGSTAAVLASALDDANRKRVAPFDLLGPMSAHLDTYNIPEVDLIVADMDEGPFVTPPTARLFVEVSVASLAYDLGRKLRLYARTGVPEYWVADVNNRRIIRFHAPSGEDYRERTTFAFGHAVPSATIPGLTVDTSRLA